MEGMGKNPRRPRRAFTAGVQGGDRRGVRGRRSMAARYGVAGWTGSRLSVVSEWPNLIFNLLGGGIDPG
jgi:hypothetical protein